MNSPIRPFRFFGFVVVLSAFSGCAWMERQTQKIVDGQREIVKEELQKEVVPRAQYEELLNKYQELQKSALADSDYATNPMASKIQDAEMETVDVFSSQDKKSDSTKPIQQIDTAPSGAELPEYAIEGQVGDFQKALEQFRAGQWEKARPTLLSKVDSPVLQIAVRANFYLGETAFAQKKMDEAKGYFEKVVTTYAFSGLVVPSLERLVIIYRTLGQKESAEKYDSILRDVFGMDAANENKS